MPLQIIRQDITKMKVDAIVNTTNEDMVGYSGVDLAVHEGAGPELDVECSRLAPLGLGSAKITKGYKLPARYVIHTVGPIYGGRKEDAVDLHNCYWNSLEIAKKYDVHSIAFPAISTGVYGYPLLEAVIIAIRAVKDWLEQNQNYDMKVIFSCFDDRTFNFYREELGIGD